MVTTSLVYQVCGLVPSLDHTQSHTQTSLQHWERDYTTSEYETRLLQFIIFCCASCPHSSWLSHIEGAVLGQEWGERCQHLARVLSIGVQSGFPVYFTQLEQVQGPSLSLPPSFSLFLPPSSLSLPPSYSSLPSLFSLLSFPVLSPHLLPDFWLM